MNLQQADEQHQYCCPWRQAYVNLIQRTGDTFLTSLCAAAVSLKKLFYMTLAFNTKELLSRHSFHNFNVAVKENVR